MSPMIPRVGDEHLVAASWERFVRHATPPALPVRDVVQASWLRCHAEAVDPSRGSAPGVADQDQLAQLRHGANALCDAAQPVLKTLRDVLCESGSLIMLTDADGAILDLSGENRARHAGERINLAPGGCWAESAIGTNAIGTAIAARQPVQLYASEHYCLDVKSWTCAAAPILDPLSRALLGVIDVSGTKKTFHGHSLGLVIAAARQIESALALAVTERQGRLFARSMDAFTRYRDDCVALFDSAGRLLRHNGKIAAARERHGIALPLETGARLATFDLALPPEQRQSQAPAGMRREWVQAVRAGGVELGSLLLIPLPSRPGLPPESPAPLPAIQAAGRDAFAAIIGGSAALEAAKTRARRLAPLDLPVVLLGETGVGKELFARAIHQASVRSAAPFVAINCGALARELLAGELFGHVEGAFTGARRGGAPGKFELADRGTLFLDEIGEMPLDMQPHLLRVLQDGIVVRLGDSRERRVSVRLIAATHHDLQAEVKSGRFREDLYHRLCVTTLCLPSLRERRDDIPAIVAHLNARLALKYGTPAKTLDDAACRALEGYRWPGNVRELQNVYETMFALCDGDRIDAALLPGEIAGPADAAPEPGGPGRLDEMEKQAIRAAIARADGNLSLAARTLGISRSTLYVKLAAMPDGAAAQRKKAAQP
ncbi:sigma-54-dependent Fis family transcriptional regulator [Chromobacterium sp. ATCC 53434]|uniref:sigma-54-dependent Fis family transcriptional regulator n=1 Tax=Chromobacterium sp. (strain ATCC 53434 / SC 14030) TaxID=2059672 RepID=UPI0018F1CA32|nr:sigma-54-dependent Fis family transcriptional regulator [Chromobacterium sp. ATCC 53434]